jgi:hypothetical protein
MLVPAFLAIGEFVLLAPESLERDAARILTYAGYVLPLFGPMLRVVHLQLSVLAYAGLLLVLAAIVRKKKMNACGDRVATDLPLPAVSI